MPGSGDGSGETAGVCVMDWSSGWPTMRDTYTSLCGVPRSHNVI